MCLGDWKAHGSEYYECSRYKENPNIANESVHAQAREALKKYLFYFERVCMAGLPDYMLLIHQRMRWHNFVGPPHSQLYIVLIEL